MSRERLQKYLARCGVASRRASERLIVDGRVRVNQRVAAELGATVDPDADRVEVDGQPVRPPASHSYVILHKPPGVVSTAHDPQGRPTVVDLAPTDARLYPVGRLDTDSEGLILLTDDGDLALKLTHPSHGVEKEYRVLLRGDVDRSTLADLSRGVELDGKLTTPARFEALERTQDGTWVRVLLREGRNRQIRRMVALLGLEVVRLVRVRIGPVRLGSLPAGRWRRLTDREISGLHRETT